MFSQLIRMEKRIIGALAMDVLQIPYMSAFAYDSFHDFHLLIRKHGLSAVSAFSALARPHCIILAIGLLDVSPLLQPIVILPIKVRIK